MSDVQQTERVGCSAHYPFAERGCRPCEVSLCLPASELHLARKAYAAERAQPDQARVVAEAARKAATTHRANLGAGASFGVRMEIEALRHGLVRHFQAHEAEFGQAITKAFDAFDWQGEIQRQAENQAREMVRRAIANACASSTAEVESAVLHLVRKAVEERVAAAFPPFEAKRERG